MLRTPNSELRTISPLDEILSTIALSGHPSSTKKFLFRGEGMGGIASYVAGWMAGNGMDVIVLDGANRFNPYIVSSFARKALISPEEILKRIRIARAFTCYQMAALMERLISLVGTIHESPLPKQRVILLGPLTTFLDEDVPEREVRPLFQRALNKVEEMATEGIPFFLFQTSISNPPRPPFAKGGFSRRTYFMKRLSQFSDLVWRISLEDQEPKMILEKRLELKTSLNIVNCNMRNGGPVTNRLTGENRCPGNSQQIQNTGFRLSPE